MKRSLCLAALIFFLVPPASDAATSPRSRPFRLSLLGGFAGFIDGGEGSLGNAGGQLGFSMLTDDRSFFAIRLGSLDVELGEGDEFVLDGSMDYLNLAGEYRFHEGFYESGVFIGLGVYQLEGTRRDLQPVDSTQLGLVLGATGEFEITRWLAFVAEASFHWVAFDQAQFLATGHGGLALRF